MSFNIKNPKNCVFVGTITDGVLTGNMSININVVKSTTPNDTENINETEKNRR